MCLPSRDREGVGLQKAFFISLLDALQVLFPNGAVRAGVRDPLDQVSEQRRLASHKERPQARTFAAFQEFGRDLRAVIRGVEALRDDLAQRLDVNLARCEERASAIQSLPVFDKRRPTQPNYGIFKALQMEGKQVERVRTGEHASRSGWAESEALVLEFSDGSLMGIQAVANIAQIISEDKLIEPNDLHIRFYVTYAPPMLPYGDEVA